MKQIRLLLCISIFVFCAAGCSKEETPVKDKQSTAAQEKPLMERLESFRGAYYQSSKRAMHMFEITEDGFAYNIYYSRDMVFEKNPKLRCIPVEITLKKYHFNGTLPRMVFDVAPCRNDWDHSWLDGGEFVIGYEGKGLLWSAKDGDSFGMFEKYPYEIYQDGTPSQLIRLDF